MTGKRSPGPGIQSILRNGSYLLASHWTEAVLRLVYAAAITRILGADSFGVWSYSIAVYTVLLGFTGLGLETQIPLRLGVAPRQAADLGKTTFMIRLAMLLLAVLPLAGLALVSDDGGVLSAALLLAIPALFGRGLSLHARWTFTGLEQTAAVTRISILMRIVEVIVGLGLLWAGAGILVLIALHALMWVADGLILSMLLNRRTGALAGHFDRRMAAELLSRGAPLGLAAALTQWLTSGPVILVKSVFDDLALVGQYGLAQQILVLAVASVRPFFQAALPVLGRATERGDRSASRFGLVTGVASIAVFVAAAVAAYWLGPPVVARVFGPEFALTGRLLAPLMLVGALIMASAGYVQMLAVRAIHWPDVVSGIFAAVLMLGGIAWLAPAWGIWGVVAAVAVSWFARAVSVFLVAQRML